MVKLPGWFDRFRRVYQFVRAMVVRRIALRVSTFTRPSASIVMAKRSSGCGRGRTEYRAIPLEFRAVAGTYKPLPLLIPVHRTGQMRAAGMQREKPAILEAHQQEPLRIERRDRVRWEIGHDARRHDLSEAAFALRDARKRSPIQAP